jgi:hypothetical protein
MLTGHATVKVVAGAAKTLRVAAPSNATAGTPFTITVTALDAFGNVATGYRGTVHFTSSDGAAVLPADYTFTSADNGKHTFSVTLNTAGSETITVTDTTHTAVTGHATVSVTAAAPAPDDRLGDWFVPALDAFFPWRAFGERGVFIGGR